MYYFFLYIKLIFYAILSSLCLFVAEYSQNYDLNNEFLWSIAIILSWEWWWLYYLIKTCPFQSFSENRIAILNQCFIVIICIWGFIALWLSSDSYSFSNYIDVIEYFNLICFLPISYIIFILHYIAIKIFYKKSTGDGSPRFWKQRNPNINFAAEESLTSYMPIEPNRESAYLR